MHILKSSFSAFFDFYPDLLAPILSFSRQDLIFSANPPKSIIKIEKNSLETLLSNKSSLLKRKPFSTKMLASYSKDRIINKKNEISMFINEFQQKMSVFLPQGPISNQDLITPDQKPKNPFIQRKSELSSPKLWSSLKGKLKKNLKDQIWLGITVLKSIQNLANILPEFKNLLEELPHQMDFLKKFLIISLKEVKENQPFTIGMSPLSQLLFFKHIRPEEIEYFSGFYKEIVEENHEKNELFMNIEKSHVVFQYESQYEEDIEQKLELKAMRLKKKLLKIDLINEKPSFSFEKCKEALKDSSIILIKNLQIATISTIRLIIVTIEEIYRLMRKARVWFLYEENIGLKSPEIQAFLSSCIKVLLPRQDSVKKSLYFLYNLEIEDFFLQQDLKSIIISPVLQGSFILQKSGLSAKPIKNLHDLPENPLISSENSLLLSNNLEKLRFNLNFLYSLLIQRTSYFLKEPQIQLLSPQNRDFFSITLKELFLFLKMNRSINIFEFLISSLDFLLNEQSLQVFKAFLAEYSCLEVQKQVVIDVKSFKYRLFNNYAASSQEENLYRNIQSFPDKDPIELLGLTLNEEIEMNYQKSLKFLNFLRKGMFKVQEEDIRVSKGLQGLNIKENNMKSVFSKLKKKRLETIGQEEKCDFEFLKITEFLIDFLNEFPIQTDWFSSLSLDLSNKNTAFFSSVLLNESLIGSLLHETVIKDLEFLWNFSRNLTMGLSSQTIFTALIQGQVPIHWKKQGFSLNVNSLEDFIEDFLIKLEFLHKWINKRKGEIYPVLPINKLFDPMHFLWTFLYHTAKAKNCQCQDLKFSLEKTKTFEKQDLLQGLIISGFNIKRGALNSNSNFLEDENIREFINPMPIFQMKALIRINKTMRSQGFFSFEIADLRLSNDFEWEFETQKKKPVEFFKYETKGKTEKENGSGGNVVYFVRVPMEIKGKSLENVVYFYFRSLKPQEHWIKKNTKVIVDLMH